MSFRGASESPINLLTLHVLGLWEEAGEQKKNMRASHRMAITRKTFIFSPLNCGWIKQIPGRDGPTLPPFYAPPRIPTLKIQQMPLKAPCEQ